jgi:hypothetical protein
MNSQPRRRAAAIARRSTCLLIEPLATMEFFNAIPPNANAISVSPAIYSQVTLRLVMSS